MCDFVCLKSHIKIPSPFHPPPVTTYLPSISTASPQMDVPALIIY